MAAEPWSALPLPEVIDFQEGPGILADDFREEGVPLIRLAGLERGSSVLDGCNYLDPEAVKRRWQHFRVQKGDVLLSTSATLGRTAVVEDNAVGAIPYTGIIRMRPRDDRLYAPFIRYLLQAPSFQRQAEELGVGSVIRHFGPMHLRQIILSIPPPSEQRAIARVLGSFDDKIELNRRMNRTLEEICRALFKFWFVDFGPVHAKADGRWKKGESLPGMPADMWDLWPNEFEESEIGEIPRGWTVRGLLEIAALHSGGTPTTSEPSYWGGGIPWVSGKDVSSAKGSFLLRTERTVSDKGIAHSHTSPLPARTVVITARGTVGALAILAEPMCISQTNYGLKAANGVPDNFFRFAVEGAVEGLRQESYGTIFDTITTKNLSATKVVLPTPQVLASFADRTDPLMNAILLNLRLIETLAEARDTLLPKLLSGEIRVKVDS